MTARAKPNDLSQWNGPAAKYGKFDYISHFYTLDEMLNDDFFGLCDWLQPYDMIWITDCEDQIMVVRVDDYDRGTMKCMLSRLERMHAQPVVELRSDFPDDPGFIYRWRPGRTGGHSVITEKGEVVAVKFNSREEAQRFIHNFYESGQLAVKPENDPGVLLSKNAKIYKPAGG